MPVRFNSMTSYVCQSVVCINNYAGVAIRTHGNLAGIFLKPFVLLSDRADGCGGCHQEYEYVGVEKYEYE
eukprot:scaffold647846_cov51-Prasinocladus_malaysianus.AAC.2